MDTDMLTTHEVDMLIHMVEHAISNTRSMLATMQTDTVRKHLTEQETLLAKLQRMETWDKDNNGKVNVGVGGKIVAVQG